MASKKNLAFYILQQHGYVFNLCKQYGNAISFKHFKPRNLYYNFFQKHFTIHNLYVTTKLFYKILLIAHNPRMRINAMTKYKGITNKSLLFFIFYFLNLKQKGKISIWTHLRFTWNLMVQMELNRYSS